MKNYTLSKPILFLLFCFFLHISLTAHAANYNYADLRMKNLEEMQNRVLARVKKAEALSTQDPKGAQDFLKDALQLTFSRPDTDNMVAQLVAPVRTLLRNLEVYEAVLSDIATSAIKEIKNKKLKPRERATNIIILINLMGELKPEVPNNPHIHKIFGKIKDADIEVTDDVKSEMRLRAMMGAPKSPSTIAEEVLKSSAKKAKADKAAAEKEADADSAEEN